MREITSHKVNGVNEALKVFAVDEPGHGGANHGYSIEGYGGKGGNAITILFQNGPIKVVGVNGITHEALLAILIDRLEAFQSGPYACQENFEALAGCRHALGALQRRTKARAERGVEGTHQV